MFRKAFPLANLNRTDAWQTIMPILLCLFLGRLQKDKHGPNAHAQNCFVIGEKQWAELSGVFSLLPS
jgi:hypothetical protein